MNARRTSARVFRALALASVFVVSSFAVAQVGGAPASAADPGEFAIVRSDGTQSYIFKIDARAAKPYSKAFFPTDAYTEYQKGEIVNLIQDIEWQYGIHVESMTSWVDASFMAFVDPAQLDALRKDRRVLSAIPNTNGATFSVTDTTAIWTDSRDLTAYAWTQNVPLPTETQSWGKRAVDTRTTNSTGTALVYVIDAGVGQHEDLNVIEWASPANPAKNCGTRTGVGLQACTPALMPYVVGCYTHATAVAGIIGAKVNGVGIQGVAPNASVISVAVGATPAGTCVDANLTAMNIKAAIDWVKQDIMVHHSTSVASVVNMSINWTVRDAAHIDIETSMLALSHQAPGAFIAQSAGNFYDSNTCNHAYGVPNASDGIMTVGAHNNHGQPVTPLNTSMGFYKDYAAYSIYEPGSDYGSCVEAWAPGDAIISSVGPPNSYGQDGNTLYRNYGFGSGTSFASPHVAGIAVRLIERSLYTTPSAVETAVRANFSSLNSVDPSNLPIKLPTLSPLPGTVPHSSRYAEFVVTTQCAFPAFVSSPAPGCHPLWNLDAHSGNYGAYGDGDTLSGYQSFAVVKNRTALGGTDPGHVWISFDSYGSTASTCDIKLVDPIGNTYTLASGVQLYYSVPNVVLTPYTMFYSTTCPSAVLSLF